MSSSSSSSVILGGSSSEVIVEVLDITFGEIQGKLQTVLSSSSSLSLDPPLCFLLLLFFLFSFPPPRVHFLSFLHFHFSDPRFDDLYHNNDVFCGAILRDRFCFCLLSNGRFASMPSMFCWSPFLNIGIQFSLAPFCVGKSCYIYLLKFVTIVHLGTTSNLSYFSISYHSIHEYLIVYHRCLDDGVVRGAVRKQSWSHSASRHQHPEYLSPSPSPPASPLFFSHRLINVNLIAPSPFRFSFVSDFPLRASVSLCGYSFAYRFW